MVNTIRIPKPPCPLPVLARPARQWRQREEWSRQAEESAPASPVAEQRGIAEKIKAIFRANGYEVP